MEKEFITVSLFNNKALAEKIRHQYSSKATVVFTSKNAVAATASAAGDKVSAPDWKIFCLDGATRDEVLHHYPEKSIIGTSRNAKSLASVIIEKSDEKQIVYFCGNNRRDELPEVLNSNGFSVEEIVVYETQPSPIKIVDDFNAIAFFSPSAVKSFFSVNKMDEKVICFSVGETTTAAIKKLIPNRVITTETPSEEKVIDLVVQYKGDI